MKISHGNAPLPPCTPNTNTAPESPKIHGESLRCTHRMHTAGRNSTVQKYTTQHAKPANIYRPQNRKKNTTPQKSVPLGLPVVRHALRSGPLRLLLVLHFHVRMRRFRLRLPLRLFCCCAPGPGPAPSLRAACVSRPFLPPWPLPASPAAACLTLALTATTALCFVVVVVCFFFCGIGGREGRRAGCSRLHRRSTERARWRFL